MYKEIIKGIILLVVKIGIKIIKIFKIKKLFQQFEALYKKYKEYITKQYKGQTITNNTQKMQNKIKKRNQNNDKKDSKKFNVEKVSMTDLESEIAKFKKQDNIDKIKMGSKRMKENEEYFNEKIISVENNEIIVSKEIETLYPSDRYNGNIINNGMIKMVKTEDTVGVYFNPKLKDIELWLTVNHVASAVAANWEPFNGNIMYQSAQKVDLNRNQGIVRLDTNDAVHILIGNKTYGNVSVASRIEKIYRMKLKNSNYKSDVCITSIIDYDEDDVHSGGIMVSNEKVYIITYGFEYSNMIEIYGILLDPRVPLLNFI